MSYQPPPNGFRTFVIVWATQSVSVFGSALTYFALNIWLSQSLFPLPEQRPQLAGALSAVALAFALPTVFGAPLAGAWADRHDRKRTMIAMDLTNGVLSLALGYFIITETLTLPLLLALTVLVALLGSFHFSAFDTSYAMLVPPEQLARANGMMQTMHALSGVLSPAFAAALIALPALARQGSLPGFIGAPLAGIRNGVGLTMIVDAITFLIAASVLVFLFVPSPKRSDLAGDASTPKKSLLADMKEGAVYIWHRRPMLWLLGTFTVANFTGAPMGVFEPLLVKFNLAADWTARGMTFESALALLSTLFALGGVAGGVLITLWGGLKQKRVYGVVVPLLLSGLGMMVAGFSRMIFLTGAAAMLIAMMSPFMNTHSQTIWQTQTPHELQGRVFAVRRVIAQCSWPLGTALAGWAGGRFDPGMVVAVLGAILAAFCFAQLFNRQLLRVEDKAALDAMAARAAAQSA